MTLTLDCRCGGKLFWIIEELAEWIEAAFQTTSSSPPPKRDTLAELIRELGIEATEEEEEEPVAPDHTTPLQDHRDVFHGDISVCSPSARDGSCGEDSPIKTRVLTKRRRIASDSDEETVDKVPAKNCETSVGKKLAKFKADVSESAISSPPAPRQSPKKEAVTEDTTDKSQGKVKQSCLEYNPDKGSYDPIQDASWRHGDKVPYLALAQTLEKIENVSARLKMIEILSNYFRSVIVLSPDDLLASIYLCLNKLAPAYEGTASCLFLL
ncbi:unnamed protein product [Timema podura]|uniref:DNA ligase ATP-dependent N-terminal domain-containing protein n=1 Tax=Timema podura TaxID=61482 RepID=A0ABN7PDZ0_TIMPD|nr:unnamed protein product [Timema podura]